MCVCVCVYFVLISHDNRSCVQARVAQCRALTDVIAQGSLTNISIALVGHRPISRPPTAVHRCHVDIVFCYVQEEINSIVVVFCFSSSSSFHFIFFAAELFVFHQWAVSPSHLNTLR